MDLCLVRGFYSSGVFLQNDFIGPIGSYDFHIISGAPKERDDYLKLVRPFDYQTWACLMVSLVTVCISLILINKTYAAWSNSPTKETPSQSIYSDLGKFRSIEKIVPFFQPSSFA